MNIVNTIFLISGIFLVLFGFAAILNPNLAKWINAPGIYSPTIKSIICMLIGVIFLILSLLFIFPI